MIKTIHQKPVNYIHMSLRELVKPSFCSACGCESPVLPFSFRKSFIEVKLPFMLFLQSQVSLWLLMDKRLTWPLPVL